MYVRDAHNYSGISACLEDIDILAEFFFRLVRNSFD